MEIRLATNSDFKIFLPAKEAFFLDYNTSKKERKSGKKTSPKNISLKPKNFYEKEFTDFIKNILILAIDKNKVAGYLAAKIEKNPYEKYGYISEVFVKDNFRRQGISSMLKNKLLEILKEKKINLCRVEVSPGNTAEKTYKKWGFKIDKHRLKIKF